MLHKYDSLMFTLVVESLESFDPCIQLFKLIKRCKDAIDQKTQDEARQWLERYVSRSGYHLRIGPYEHEFDSVEVARELYSLVRQFLKESNDRVTNQAAKEGVSEMLDAIPSLDALLKKRIITARLRGLLQDRHIQYHIKAASRPSTRDPSALCQDLFWQHIAERFRGQKARITIETQIDPYI